MTQKDTPEVLRTELQSLKNTLNNQAEDLISEHPPIPVLDDLFEEKVSSKTPPTETNKQAANRSTAGSTKPENNAATHHPSSIDDKLNHYLNQEKPESSLQALLDRERMVDELVEDIMPILTNRLKMRIRKLLENERSE